MWKKITYNSWNSYLRSLKVDWHGVATKFQLNLNSKNIGNANKKTLQIEKQKLNALREYNLLFINCHTKSRHQELGQRR